MSVIDELSAWRQSILADVAGMIAAALGSIHAPIRIVDVPVNLGAKGVALTAGALVFFRLGLNGQATVLTWSLGAMAAGVARTGAVTVDVQVGATLAAVASICGTGKPALAAVSERADVIPLAWTTTTIADPSWVVVTVTTTDGVLEVVGLTLRCAVSPR